MKILYLCHRAPYPPKRGGKIRPFHMIRHLTALGHEVHVGSLARSAEEAEEAAPLAEYCAELRLERVRAPLQAAKMVFNLPRSAPSSMGYFHSARLARWVKAELATGSYDFIIVFSSSMAPYVQGYRGCPKLIDLADMDSQKWITYGPMRPFPLSLGYYYEGFKVQLAEQQIARDFQCCTLTTQAELTTLHGLCPGATGAVLANGVDLSRFAPGEGDYDANTIVFIGRMDYYPNQECMFDFTARVWPRLRERRPELKLQIVGAQPSKEVWALSKLPGVEVTGTVPEVQPYVRKAACSVAPLNIARGTQNKILEAMAMEVPVVASALAAGGVDAVPGEHLLAASSTEEYLQAILQMVEQPEARARIAKAGRARVASHHNWEKFCAGLELCIEDCKRRFDRPEGVSACA